MIEPTGMGALYGALAKAQAIIGGAAKDRVNPAFKSKYADLASVWDAWQAAGPQFGLGIIQMPGAFINGTVSVTTILTHESGVDVRETMTVPVTKQDAQGVGSAITYARRYMLAAFAGIAPEDDDGNAASQRGSNAPASAPSGPISAEQLAGLIMLKDESGADTAKMCKAFDVASLAALPVSELARATAMLRQKIKINAKDKIAPNLNGGEHATRVA